MKGIATIVLHHCYHPTSICVNLGDGRGERNLESLDIVKLLTLVLFLPTAGGLKYTWAVFLSCCSDCLNCQACLNSIGWATWGVIKEIQSMF